jgi:predicted nucleotidyltransferase
MKHLRGQDVQQIAIKARPIFNRYKIQKAILFGSMARGCQDRKSDMDLLLIQRTEKPSFERFEGLLRELYQVFLHPLAYRPLPMASCLLFITYNLWPLIYQLSRIKILPPANYFRYALCARSQQSQQRSQGSHSFIDHYMLK